MPLLQAVTPRAASSQAAVDFFEAQSLKPAATYAVPANEVNDDELLQFATTTLSKPATNSTGDYVGLQQAKLPLGARVCDGIPVL